MSDKVKNIVIEEFNRVDDAFKTFRNNLKVNNKIANCIEFEKQYCEISLSRIDYALNKFKYDELKYIEEEKKAQARKWRSRLIRFCRRVLI